MSCGFISIIIILLIDSFSMDVCKFVDLLVFKRKLSYYYHERYHWIADFLVSISAIVVAHDEILTGLVCESI